MQDSSPNTPNKYGLHLGTHGKVEPRLEYLGHEQHDLLPVSVVLPFVSVDYLLHRQLYHFLLYKNILINLP